MAPLVRSEGHLSRIFRLLLSPLVLLAGISAGSLVTSGAAFAAAPEVALHPVCPDPPPRIGSPCPAVLPAVVARGTTVPIAVLGTGFASAPNFTAWFADSQISLASITVVNDNLFVAVMTVGASASQGGAIIHVKNDDGEKFCTACGPTVF